MRVDFKCVASVYPACFSVLLACTGHSNTLFVRAHAHAHEQHIADIHAQARARAHAHTPATHAEHVGSRALG